jgi:hypothetical protein
MSGLDGAATHESFGRRTPEGVAPGAVGQPIINGATTLGFAVTPGRFRPAALSSSSAFFPGRSS